MCWLLKLLPGNRKKWHFRAPKNKNFSSVRQTPVAYSTKNTPYFPVNVLNKQLLKILAIKEPFNLMLSLACEQSRLAQTQRDIDNGPRSIYQYYHMVSRLSRQTSIFGGILLVSKFLL